MSQPKVLAFAGSLRKDSWNKKLVRTAAQGARNAGASVSVVDLADYPLPIYNEDDELASGLPENARKLKDLFLDHQGLLISSPEYNSSISAALKNAIDWVSRPAVGESSLQCFAGKVAGLLAASPGALGGLRGLAALRSILGNIMVIVLPEQFALVKAHEAFDGDALKDAKKKGQVEEIGAKVAGILKMIHGR